MGSTVRQQPSPVEVEPAVPGTIRWRNWPLVDHMRSSWLLPLGILSVAVFVGWLGDSWLLAVVAVALLALALWQFFIPVTYEICPLGIRRYALGRMRLVPWLAIRAYQ